MATTLNSLLYTQQFPHWVQCWKCSILGHPRVKFLLNYTGKPLSVHEYTITLRTRGGLHQAVTIQTCYKLCEFQ